ncbi:hypothetical protein Y032_0003g1301 [Ancylostoma ceylanicum]|uniref:Transmembrane protein n=1 Tax=Ancylostoma ceylanicum TaxID=53326 RepID=A0A016VWC2_9BILA|nr:hypothetical protein Y032_0003g1301 [Ancylostoma ceylanicum]
MEGRDKSVYLQSITTSSDGHNEQPRKQKRLLCTPTLMPIFLVMVIVIVVFSSNSVTLTHYVHFAKNVRESISQKETNPSFASKGIYLPTNLKPPSSHALIYPNLQWILHIRLKIGFKSTKLFFVPLKSVVKDCFCGCLAQELRVESVPLAGPKI